MLLMRQFIKNMLADAITQTSNFKIGEFLNANKQVLNDIRVLHLYIKNIFVKN